MITQDNNNRTLLPLGIKSIPLRLVLTLSLIFVVITFSYSFALIDLSRPLEDRAIVGLASFLNNPISIAEIITLTILCFSLLFGATLACVLLYYQPIKHLSDISDQIISEEAFTGQIPYFKEPNLHQISNALRELNSQFQYRISQLDLASQISNDANLKENINLFLEQVAHNIQTQLGCYDVRIYTVIADANKAQLRAGSGAESEFLLSHNYREMLDQYSLVGKALTNHKTILIHGQDSAENNAVIESSELIVPFYTEVISGALHIIGRRPNQFDNLDVNIYQLIASIIGDNLMNKQTVDAMQQAVQQTEEANRMKSTFLANMSHELRTPLNAILNFTGFVIDGDAGPVNELQIDFLDKAHGAGKHLLGLINEILDLSKIEAGMMDFLLENVDLNDLFDNVLGTASGLIENKPIRIDADVQENIPHTLGDIRRLRQVFLNVFSNAVKFTPEGTIHFKAQYIKEPNLVEIQIRDTGIGIAPENQPFVFEPFQQIKHDLEVSGTGLGMPISKYLVEKHDGQIWFESALGIGTTFFITLPIRNDDLLASVIEEKDKGKRARLLEARSDNPLGDLTKY